MEKEEFQRSLKRIHDSIWDLKQSSTRLRSGTNNDLDLELHDLESKLHEALTPIAKVRRLLSE